MDFLFRTDPLRDPGPLIRRVYSYVAYRIGPGPEAEDVTSEVFEHALRYRRSFDPDKGEPLAWLIGIARRCIAEAFAVRPWTEEELGEGPAADDVEEIVIRRIDVRDSVSRLGERDRELIALRYGADLGSREIGEILGLKTNTVEVALHRAVGRLQSKL